MPMLLNPREKYAPFQTLELPTRQWPSKTLEKPPRWLSTDLRDGNQSLVDPMSAQQKLEYFRTLVSIGFKEIEIAFPSASSIEFDFVRGLIQNGEIPDDVTIQVLTPCREDLIRKTIESVHGAKRAIIHLYNATSPCFRRVVFGASKEATVELAIKSTKLIRQLTKDSNSQTQWTFEYSPETFSATESDFAIEICSKVLETWDPSESNPIIFNLPATVEMSTPNVYADQIEYFHTHIPRRSEVCISLHAHNDRGCAVAASEMGQLAGADRIEGCLFGNGERTGNVDLVTLALNLYTQGVSPNLDFSRLHEIKRICESCNEIEVHPRHPYSGELVFTAFSGSHQDAIKKGFEKRKEGDIWEMPYLPIDPKDIGASYEAVIRVNSQSGKAGISWIILQTLHLDLPRRLQIAFSKVVQQFAEKVSRELSGNEIRGLFEREYYLDEKIKLKSYSLTEENEKKNLKAVIERQEKMIELTGEGNGALSALVDALNRHFSLHLDIRQYSEHSIGVGSGVKAASYIELVSDDNLHWGVGLDPDIVGASLRAVISAFSAIMGEPLSDLNLTSDRVNGSAQKIQGKPEEVLTMG